MMVVAGILPAVPDASELTLAHPWIWWRACDLRPGWVVQLADGRSAEVVSEPELAVLGKVCCDVSWQGQPPEAASWPWAKLLRCRPLAWEDAYVEAVSEWAAKHMQPEEESWH